VARIIEEEQALIINHEKPEVVAAEVSELVTLGKFNLLKQETQYIEDTYYDTPYWELRSSKISLRIRRVTTNERERVLVTWKGGNKAYTGIQKREEFEVEWPFAEVDPAIVLGIFELEPIQIRSTVRNPLIVLDGPHDVAELAIDNVLYRFEDGTTARLYEVEVELHYEPKHKKVTKLSDIVDPLVKEFPELNPWSHSKFSTGQAIEKALKITQRADGTLNPGSYEFISSLIRT
jgi:inorganic triphosphatase YgiF